jgi:uncharacterized membrane protein
MIRMGIGSGSGKTSTSEWLLWNHVRTIASILAAALGIAALTV